LRRKRLNEKFTDVDDDDGRIVMAVTFDRLRWAKRRDSIL